jgi:tetratricopeptide (TPR) repeat protein
MQMLPTKGKPILQWPDPEEAYADVATGVGRVVNAICAQKWKLQGDANYSQEAYDLALVAYEEAILLVRKNPYFYYVKGKALFHLQRFEDAITAHSKAIELNPDFRLAYEGKGDALDAFAPRAKEYYQRLAELSYRQATLLERLEEGREK